MNRKLILLIALEHSIENKLYISLFLSSKNAFSYIWFILSLITSSLYISSGSSFTSSLVDGIIVGSIVGSITLGSTVGSVTLGSTVGSIVGSTEKSILGIKDGSIEFSSLGDSLIWLFDNSIDCSILSDEFEGLLKEK